MASSSETQPRLVTKSGRSVKLTERMANYLSDQREVQERAQQYPFPAHDDIGPDDSASFAGLSRLSKQSGKSARSTASVMRLKEEQKKAELSAKASALKEMHEIELRKRQFEVDQRIKTEQLEAQLRIERQRLENEIEISRLEFKRLEEEFKIKTELAVSNAKTEVLDRFESCSLMSAKPEPSFKESIIDQPTEQTLPHKVTWGQADACGTEMRPTAAPFVPPTPGEYEQCMPFNQPPCVQTSVPAKYTSTPTEKDKPFVGVQDVTTIHPLQNNHLTAPLSYSEHDNSSSNELSRLADILSNRHNLPTLEPEVFSGDILLYAQWQGSFETLVDKNVSSPIMKLYYLGKYTSGQARESIQGLLSLKSPQAYDDARAILDERYGNKYRIYEAFRNKLRSWPVIKGDGEELRKFSDFLCNCMSAMESVHYLRVLDDAEENQRLLSKLPRYLVQKWSRIVDKYLHCIDMTPHYPSFAEFCNFLKKESRIACGPVKYKGEEDQKKSARKQFSSNKQTARSYATNTVGIQSPSAEVHCNSTAAKSSENPTRVPSCTLCKGQHSIDTCPDFVRLDVKERLSTARAKMLCFKCLRWGHTRKDCRSRTICTVCKKGHPTILHDDTYQSNRKDANCKQGSTETENELSQATINKTEGCESGLQGDNCFHSLILPVNLHHSSRPHEKRVVYALLDPQSNACFVSKKTMELMKVTGLDVQLKLRTMLGEDVISCQKVTDLVITNMEGTVSVQVPECYSRDQIASSKDQIPRPETIKSWPHLRNVASQLHPFVEGAEIGLLIGTNLARVMKPRNCVPGKGNDPYAVKTELGWGVIGQMNSAGDQQVETFCHSVVADERKVHFAFRTQVKEVSPAQVAHMFAIDFNERQSDEKMSTNDRRFLQKLNSGIHQRLDAHFETPLPFVQDEVLLPNNKQSAHKRLMKLREKLMLDPRYKSDYVSFMSNIIDKDYAEKVPGTEPLPGHTWYIPHHGVYHPRKPGKLRVVFDCSAQYGGEVLNRHLLQGPDLINNLTGVLCRFRKEPIAFSCDIEAMFYQVGVNEEDRNYLRFLWWENGQMDRDPTEYRMKVHLFGASSSPGCANFALKHTADLYEKEVGKEAAEFVRDDFYVDDGLKSVSSPQAALDLIESSRRLCAMGGFNLHKFTSNDQTVLEAVPLKLCGKAVQNLNLLHEEDPIERTLGVEWCLVADTFKFRVTLQTKTASRRGILSTVSSVFDPLGLLSPFILSGKQILQELCQNSVDWDEPLTEDITMRWEKWKSEVVKLSALDIPRCYKPRQFGIVKTVEIHNFSDASLQGYGACSYLRLIDNKGQVATSLLMAKSRVAPTKGITVPRLELTAAVVSVKIGKFLCKELKYHNVQHFYWTDSNVVLGYINNDSRRFHIYVANRVQQIRDCSSSKQWRHIDTKSNPADLASRGAGADDLMQNELWWKGPTFLSTLDPLPSAIPSMELQLDDPEVKVVHNLQATESKDNFEMSRFDRFSSWHRAKKAIAICLRFKDILRKKRTDTGNLAPLTTEELANAEKAIIKVVQRQHFLKEIEQLSLLKCKNKPSRKPAIMKTSCLFKLNPFLDEDGILRVGGRISRADYPLDVVHPVILPKISRCHVSKLIIRDSHEAIKHQGRGMTISHLRGSGYWVVGVVSAVSSYIRSCVKCQRLYAVSETQQMADLPTDRLGHEDLAPFSQCGVDLFGPWIVKEGRKEVKRYGVLFTCLSSRAVHVETANSLSTDSFLNALRRFMAVRGPIDLLRSDRGTNFVGAEAELSKALGDMDHNKIHNYLLEKKCDYFSFKMNKPSASHAGGAWERQIKSVRRVLNSLLLEFGEQLDDESLRTLLLEASAIVNSRLLSVENLSDVNSVAPVTPNHLLTMKSQVLLPPPGVFQREDLYSKRRWRRVQYLLNQFWIRWRREYLQNLQTRQKWNTPKRNIHVGDVVLMTDDNLPRSVWPVARVVDVYTSQDGHVRSVRLQLGNRHLNTRGKPTHPVSYLERPIQKLVVLLKSVTEDSPTESQPCE